MKRLENGFTFVEMLLSFVIYLMIVFSIPLLFKVFSSSTTGIDFNHFEWQTFIAQSKLEMNESSAITVSDHLVSFSKYSGEVVTYELYNHNIRRKVNGRGYEILLQHIQSISYNIENNGVTIRCKDEGNDVYTARISSLVKIDVNST